MLAAVAAGVTAIGEGRGSADGVLPADAASSDSAVSDGAVPAVAMDLPDPLPLEPQVKDPVFSVLVGLVRANLYGSLTPQRLEKALGGQLGRSRLPYQRLRELRRVADVPGHTARVTLTLDRALKLPIPYTILWYHPGSFATSETCFFREWMLGSVSVAIPEKEGGAARAVQLEDVHLFALDRGRIQVDIDAWLDRLMGSALDDTSVTGILLFRRNGRWLGLAVGYNNDGRGRSGTFDFSDDRVLFPVPAEMRAVSRQMRARMESLMASHAGARSGGRPAPERRDGPGPLTGSGPDRPRQF